MLLQKKKYGILDMVTLSFKVSPFYSTVFALQRIISALMPTFTIFITASLINTATAILNKTADISAIYVPIILLASVVLYRILIEVLMSFVNCKANIFYRRKLRPEMVEKLARLEYRHIENQKTADLISRVCPKFDVNVREM